MDASTGVLADRSPLLSSDSSDGDGGSQVRRPDVPPSEDDLFVVLSNRRRRHVIEYLLEGDGTATIGELAEDIAVEENDTTLQQLTSSERKCVYISLYQNHLPVMDEANVVDYEENRKTVRLAGDVSTVEPHLRDAARPGESRIPAVAALAVATVVVLGGFQVGALAAFPTAGWTLLGALGLVGVACFQLYAVSGGRSERR